MKNNAKILIMLLVLLAITFNAYSQAPGAFGLVSPANGSWVSATPIFDWADASGATSYQLWIDGNQVVLPNHGNYCARASYSLPGKKTLTTPSLNISGTATLEYWWNNHDKTYGKVIDHDTTFCEISTNAGTTWNLLKTLTDNMPTYTLKKETINISSYAGNNVKIRWRYSTDGTNEAFGVGLDDVKIFSNGNIILNETFEGSFPSANWYNQNWTKYNLIQLYSFCLLDSSNALTEGVHTWTVKAVNASGITQANDTWSIMVDATPPNVFDLTTPANNSWSTNLKPTLSWSNATDNGSGIDKYQLWIDGFYNRDSIPSTATSTTPKTFLTNGSHTWQIKAIDVAGNVRNSSQIFTIKIDNAPPIGQTNRCLSFDNQNNDYVEVPHSSSLNLGNTFTIESWSYVETIPDEYDSPIIRKNDAYGIYCKLSNNQLKFAYTGRNNAGVGFDVTSNQVLNYYTWYHLAATYDGAYINLFINGVLDKSQYVGNNAQAAGQSADNLFIGGIRISNSLYAHCRHGYLDELRIWNTTRNEIQINSNKNIPLKGNEPGLVAYWRCNENDGNTLIDKTGNMNHGQLKERSNGNGGPKFLNVHLDYIGILCKLKAPVNQYISNNKPTFKWGSAPDAGVGFQKFQLFVDNIQVADNLTDSTYTLTTPLSYGNHNWFVKGFYLLDNCQSSEIAHFNIDNRPPAPFSLNTPLDSGIVNLPTPSLSWIATTDSTGGSGLRKYQLYINGNVNRDSISSAVTTITPAQALPQGAYTWYINALDNAGNVKKSTQTRIFYVDYQPPTAFNLVSPANNSEALSKRPTFIWRKSKDLGSGLRKYELTISGYPPIKIAPTDTIKTIGFDLPNANYTWFVKAIDRGGASTSSPTYNLTVNVPYPPALSAPQNNTINQALTPFLRWSKVSVANGYHLQVSAVSNFSTFVLNDSLITDTLKQVTGLTNNTKYWWRVKAKRNEVSSDYSAAWNFTTIIAAPVQPVLATPTNNAVNQPINPLLSWNAVSNAATYRLQAAKDSLFVDKIFDDSTLTGISKKLIGLEYSKKYFWRVNAKNIGGISNWSEVNKFKTREVLTFNLPSSLIFAEDTKDTIDLAQYVNELPSDTLNYTIWGNQNIQVVISNNKAMFTPAANWNGTENIIFTLTSNTKSLSGKSSNTKNNSFKDFRTVLKDTIAVTVTPVADVPVINLPAKFTWGEDSIKTINFAPYLSDADGNNLSLSCIGNTHLQISFNNSLVTVKPDSNWFGNELVTFTANDGTKKCKNTKLTASDTVRFVIKPVNDAPIVTFFSPSNSDTVIVFKDSTIVFKVRAYDVDSQIGYQWYIGNTLNPSTDSLLAKVFTTTGYYTVKSRIGDNIAFIETVWHVKVEMASNIDNQNLLPAVVKLEKNYPNPFNNTTSIKFALPKSDYVTLTIYNLKGEAVKQLANGNFKAGYHTISFDAAKLSSGVYTYTLKTKEKSITNRMLLVK